MVSLIVTLVIWVLICLVVYQQFKLPALYRLDQNHQLEKNSLRAQLEDYKKRYKEISETLDNQLDLPPLNKDYILEQWPKGYNWISQEEDGSIYYHRTKHYWDINKGSFNNHKGDIHTSTGGQFRLIQMRVLNKEVLKKYLT